MACGASSLSHNWLRSPSLSPHALFLHPHPLQVDNFTTANLTNLQQYDINVATYPAPSEKDLIASMLLDTTRAAKNNRARKQ